MNQKIKVFFIQKLEGGLLETESIWCVRDGENFIVDNIPFVAKRISLGDTIKAEYDSGEKVYYFEGFVRVSGNTTVRLYFNDAGIIEQIRSELNDLGCEGEIFLRRKILAVNVPECIKYKAIKEYLENGEKQNIWQYEESCLAHEHLPG
jgi:hypothetical protein